MRELVLKAREDEGARLEIIRSYEPLIKKCIRMYVKDFDYHRDALQYGYMVVLQCINKYDINTEYPFGAYLKTSLIYAMKDFAGKIKGDLSLDEELGDEGGTLIDTLIGPDRVEESIIMKEDVKKLYAALDKLSEKQRNIIEEVFFKDRSMIDICRGRRCHYMTVVRLKDRALKTLREEMKRNY